MTLLISQQLHITATTMLTKAYGTREGSMMYVSAIIGVHLDFVTLCIRDSLPLINFHLLVWILLLFGFVELMVNR